MWLRVVGGQWSIPNLCHPQGKSEDSEPDRDGWSGHLDSGPVHHHPGVHPVECRHDLRYAAAHDHLGRAEHTVAEAGRAN